MKKRRRAEDEKPKSQKKKVEFRDEQQPAGATSFSVTKIRKPQVSPPVVGEAPRRSKSAKDNGTDPRRSAYSGHLPTRRLPLQCLRKGRTTRAQAAKERRPASGIRDGAALFSSQDGGLHSPRRTVEERRQSTEPLPCHYRSENRRSRGCSSKEDGSPWDSSVETSAG